MLFFISCYFLIALALSIYIPLKFSRCEFPVKLLVFTNILMGFAAALFIVSRISLQYSLSQWNCCRLAPSFMLAKGFALYTLPGEGVISGHIYGPLAAAAYLPAVIFPSLKGALICGLWLSAGFALLPVLFIIFSASGGPHRRVTAWAAFFVFFCFASGADSLKDTFLSIHADAPALGLGALAGLALLRLRDDRDRVLLAASSLLAVLACWTKQVMLAGILALPFYLYLAWGRKVFLRYVIYLLAWSAVTALVFFSFFDPEAMFYNLFLMPMKHPFSPYFTYPLRYLLTRELGCGLFVFISLALAGLIFCGKAFGIRQMLRQDRWLIFLFLSLALMPVSVLTKLKAGGALNTLSFITYYFFIAASAALAGVISDTADKGGRGMPALARIMVAAFLLVNLPYLFSHSYDDSMSLREPYAPACRFLERHKGEVYFPGNPLLHLAVEGKAYHFSDAIADRELAGDRVGREQFFRHIPPRLAMVVLPENEALQRSTSVLRYLPEFSKRIDIEELAGWHVYVRQQ